MENKNYNLNLSNSLTLKMALSVDLSILHSDSNKNYISIDTESFSDIIIENNNNEFSIIGKNSMSLSDLKDIFFNLNEKKIDALKNIDNSTIHIIARLYISNNIKYDIKVNSGSVTIYNNIDFIDFKGNNINLNSEGIIINSHIKINHGNIKLKLCEQTNNIDIKLNNGNLQLIQTNYNGNINGKIKNNKYNNGVDSNKTVEFKINSGNFEVI